MQNSRGIALTTDRARSGADVRCAPIRLGLDLQGGIHMMLELESPAGLSAEARSEAVERAVDQLDLTIRGLQSLITELRPAALDELGIRPAVEALVERTRATSGIEVDLRMPGAPEAMQLEPELATTVYRLVQEALTNAVKHANAESVSVEILERGPELTVKVRDDGSGFGPEDQRDGGFGLIGMEERVSLVGGRLEIDSVSGEGTTVRAWLPARHAEKPLS
jgi:signal transduction histidine kinase